MPSVRRSLYSLVEQKDPPFECVSPQDTVTATKPYDRPEHSDDRPTPQQPSRSSPRKSPRKKKVVREEEAGPSTYKKKATRKEAPRPSTSKTADQPASPAALAPASPHAHTVKPRRVQWPPEGQTSLPIVFGPVDSPDGLLNEDGIPFAVAEYLESLKNPMPWGEARAHQEFNELNNDNTHGWPPVIDLSFIDDRMILSNAGMLADSWPTNDGGIQSPPRSQ